MLLELDDPALGRKFGAALGYRAMRAEVERALQRFGPSAFRYERLRPAADPRPLAERLPVPPSYETYGERQVAAGHYREVLRFREHFLPLAEDLAAWARR